MIHYITSKAGVIGFTRSIATEFGVHGVTANAIAPGLTRTPGTLAEQEIPGGMARTTIPSERLPDAIITQKFGT